MEVKVIDTPTVNYSALKFIRPDDKPIDTLRLRDRRGKATSQESSSTSSWEQNNNNNHSNGVTESELKRVGRADGRSGNQRDGVGEREVQEGENHTHPVDVDLAGKDAEGAGGEVVEVKRYTNGSEFFNDESAELDDTIANTMKRLLARVNVHQSLRLSGLCHALSFAHLNVLILWLITPVSLHGLDYSIFGAALALIVLFLCSSLSIVFFFKRIAGTYGIISVLKYSGVVYCSSLFFLPLSTLLSKQLPLWLTRTAASVPLVLATTSIQWACVSSAQMVLHSCYVHQRPTALLLAELPTALFSILLTCFSSNIYSWSLGNGLPWPLDHALVWYIFAYLAVEMVKTTRKLRKTLNRPKREPLEPRYAATMIRSRVEEQDATEKAVVKVDGGVETVERELLERPSPAVTVSAASQHVNQNIADLHEAFGVTARVGEGRDGGGAGNRVSPNNAIQMVGADISHYDTRVLPRTD